MRFYLMTVQHNKEADAENRIAPKAFDLEEEAIAEFHTQMGKDMKNSTLDWAISVIINEYGGIIKNERWTRYVEPEIIEEPEIEEIYSWFLGDNVEAGKYYNVGNNIICLALDSGEPTSAVDSNFFEVIKLIKGTN